MERGRRGCSGIGRKGVALQAKQVDLRALEKPRVGIAVWRVTGDAAFGLQGRMLVDERARFVAMALEASNVP